MDDQGFQTLPKRSSSTSIKDIEFDGNTVLCRVCGDRASGFHYGVHACEGCKGFFRRSIQQKIQYRPCVKNQHCLITRVNRNRCQYCRLKKCISIGMSRDAVRFGRVPKREKAKILEQMHKVNVQCNEMSSTDLFLSDVKEFRRLIVEANAQTCQFTNEKMIKFIEESKLKSHFVNCSSRMACPLNPNPEHEHSIADRWNQYSNGFMPAIHNTVTFAKLIPGFSSLTQSDQIILLKAGTFELLLLQLSGLFETKSECMYFVNGKIFKRNSHSPTSGAGYLLDSVFDFAERLSMLMLTDAQMALFSAYVLLSPDRPGLHNVGLVEQIQSTIGQLLRCEMNKPDTFDKLLSKIPEMRLLNTVHSEKLLGLPVPSACSHYSSSSSVTSLPSSSPPLPHITSVPKLSALEQSRLFWSQQQQQQHHLHQQQQQMLFQKQQMETMQQYLQASSHSSSSLPPSSSFSPSHCKNQLNSINKHEKNSLSKNIDLNIHKFHSDETDNEKNMNSADQKCSHSDTNTMANNNLGYLPSLPIRKSTNTTPENIQNLIINGHHIINPRSHEVVLSTSLGTFHRTSLAPWSNGNSFVNPAANKINSTDHSTPTLLMSYLSSTSPVKNLNKSLVDDLGSESSSSLTTTDKLKSESPSSDDIKTSDLKAFYKRRLPLKKQKWSPDLCFADSNNVLPGEMSTISSTSTMNEPQSVDKNVEWPDKATFPSKAYSHSQMSATSSINQSIPISYSNKCPFDTRIISETLSVSHSKHKKQLKFDTLSNDTFGDDYITNKNHVKEEFVANEKSTDHKNCISSNFHIQSRFLNEPEDQMCGINDGQKTVPMVYFTNLNPKHIQIPNAHYSPCLTYSPTVLQQNWQSSNNLDGNNNFPSFSLVPNFNWLSSPIVTSPLFLPVKACASSNHQSKSSDVDNNANYNMDLNMFNFNNNN